MAVTKAVQPQEQKPKPEAVVVIEFYPNSIVPRVEGFLKLSPRRIQRSLHLVYKEWNRQRKELLNSRKVVVKNGDS